MPLKTAALKKNDRVGLVSPGTRPESAATVAYAVRVIEEMGFVPLIGKNVLECHGHLAGTDAQRLEDINAFIADDSVAAIFCITGGFGSLPLLPQLDFETIKKKPKLFVGSDENTALLMAVHSVCSIPVVLGPNLDRVNNEKIFDGLKTALTATELIKVQCAKDKFGPKSHVSKSYSSVTGSGSGVVIGGNLSAVLSLMGTPFQPNFQSAILYLDDYNERFDILDRWFTTLYVSNAISETAGVLFGNFTGCGARGNTSVLPIEDLFGERLKELRKPNMFGLPVGRFDATVSMPLGIPAHFDTSRATLEFDESPFA